MATAPRCDAQSGQSLGSRACRRPALLRGPCFFRPARVDRRYNTGADTHGGWPTLADLAATATGRATVAAGVWRGPRTVTRRDFERFVAWSREVEYRPPGRPAAPDMANIPSWEKTQGMNAPLATAVDGHAVRLLAQDMRHLRDRTVAEVGRVVVGMEARHPSIPDRPAGRRPRPARRRARRRQDDAVQDLRPRPRHRSTSASSSRPTCCRPT